MTLSSCSYFCFNFLAQLHALPLLKAKFHPPKSVIDKRGEYVPVNKEDYLSHADMKKIRLENVHRAAQTSSQPTIKTFTTSAKDPVILDDGDDDGDDENDEEETEVKSLTLINSSSSSSSSSSTSYSSSSNSKQSKLRFVSNDTNVLNNGQGEAASSNINYSRDLVPFSNSSSSNSSSSNSSFSRKPSKKKSNSNQSKLTFFSQKKKAPSKENVRSSNSPAKKKLKSKYF